MGGGKEIEREREQDWEFKEKWEKKRIEKG